MRISMTRVLFLCLLFMVTTISPCAARRRRGVRQAFDVILQANAGTRNVREGDILQNIRRTAYTCVNANCKWPKVDGVVKVPYAFTSKYTRSLQRTIENALKIFKEHTCVEFVERTDETDYISFIDAVGCMSYVGRQGGKQDVYLYHRNRFYTCVVSGVVQHEALHALGFLHEQNRNDRDDYVTIHYENIEAGTEANFDLHNTVNFNIPYDYNSVLHYSRTAFSKNGQPTITANDDYNRILGGYVMTDADFARVNALYECSIP